MNAAPLELLLEHCGFHGISLVVPVTEMDALCCSGIEEGSDLGRVGFGGSSAFTPLWPLLIPEVTEPSLSCVDVGFCSVESMLFMP